jgi:hypothetical protein
MFISSLVEVTTSDIFVGLVGDPLAVAGGVIVAASPPLRRVDGRGSDDPGDHARPRCGNFLHAQRTMPSTVTRIENSIPFVAYQDISASYNRKSVGCRRADAITAPFSRFWLHLIRGSSLSPPL